MLSIPLKNPHTPNNTAPGTKGAAGLRMKSLSASSMSYTTHLTTTTVHHSKATREAATRRTRALTFFAIRHATPALTRSFFTSPGFPLFFLRLLDLVEFGVSISQPRDEIHRHGCNHIRL